MGSFFPGAPKNYLMKMKGRISSERRSGLAHPYDRESGEWLAHWVRRLSGVRRVRFGYNPNSSSLGVNVSILLYGTVALAVLAPTLGVTVRMFRKGREAAEPVKPGTAPDESVER